MQVQEGVEQQHRCWYKLVSQLKFYYLNAIIVKQQWTVFVLLNLYLLLLIYRK